MSKLFCNQSSKFFPIFTELEDLRSTCIANCVFNIFLSYTAFMLNIVTIYAIYKTSTMPKTLKTLLLSLACSDVAVGLFSQPLYTFFLINWLRLHNPSCNTKQVRTISNILFSGASFLGVVAVSVDRFLAVHFHLRYQEVVTHRRVVIVVIGIWVKSTFVSLIILWGLLSTRDLINTIIEAFSLIITFVVYIRIYITVRRHKNHIHSMQIRDEAQSEELKNLIVLIKSTVGIFYVYLVFLICYLPHLICMAVIRTYGSSIVLKKLLLYSLTLMYLNSSLNPIIYCWKMRHIRHAIMDILRKMSWINNLPFRINYNRSSSVVHIDN
ncbi:adenosine receptor A3-like [Pocillopora verrucosa]|uniref:adenosine receptor A3-like n=1 Tax=Pocillopora verrucosa TaxID=203993 RepID=UPI002797A0B0|nr:adenosine receptor A3-like [Pocillopora verrucosa]